MAKLNTKSSKATLRTHEGAPARRINAEQQLRRSVLSCLLWEDEFYEDGKTIAENIILAAGNVPNETIANLAIEARNDFNLRHVSLLLLSILCAHTNGNDISDVFDKVIKRADELAEFVSVYAHVNGVTPDKVKKKLSAQAKKGLAKAFQKFDAYQLGKYNRDGAVKLRDVLFLCHAKPRDDAQAATWKKLVDGTLESPDTWEVNLSGGADKRETFERLITEGKLGYMALLRNLRNMEQAGVDRALIKTALLEGKGSDNVLPFRYLAAARHAPSFERELDAAMMKSIDAMPSLSGKTVVLVDVSGSMCARLSGKSELTRQDAASALGAIIKSDDLRVFSFTDKLVEVPPRRGMAGIDAITKSQSGGTYLGRCMKQINDSIEYDRIIVITDEESFDPVPNPVEGKKGYMINVASSQNGVGYGPWIHFDGFSENVIKFIHELECM